MQLKRCMNFSITFCKITIKNAILLLKENPNADTLIKGESLIKRISNWEENLIQENKTFQDVINFIVHA